MSETTETKAIVPAVPVEAAATVAVPTAPPQEELVVIARDPVEMAAAQAKMTAWAAGRLQRAQAQLAEAEAVLEHARAAKWKITNHQRQVFLAKKDIIYYEKVKAALEAGFCIVPDFPVDLFALRVTRDFPQRNDVTGNQWVQPAAQIAAAAPQGEGENVNPHPAVSYTLEENVPGKSPIYRKWADEWQEPDLPLKFAKPMVMDATRRAMAMKLFDEIGLLPARPKRDPMVIGRICHGVRQYGGPKRSLSFVIAFIDVREL